METTTVHRETLYQQVWEEPISRLARRYNVSDVALAKACRKLMVPVPPRGYWARVQNGQRLTAPKLPKLLPGVNDRATISPVKSRSHELPESVKKQLKFEAEPGHQISSDRNRELLPLVRKTRTVLNGKSASLDQEAQLSICVNKPSQERAFALLSSLLYAFDARGFKVELRVGNDRGSLVIINEESLHFSLEEESKRVEVQGAKFSFGKTYEKKWTGKLTFRIHDWFAQRRQMAWSDSVRQPLEDQFNRMIPALVELSLVIREKRLAQEAKMAAFHEQIRQRDLDIRRRRQLECKRGFLAALFGTC
jgi:hypothetical protein